MRHEFAADVGNKQKSCGKDDQRREERGRRMVEAPVQASGIKALETFKDFVGALANVLQPVGTEHRNKRERKQQRPEQGERHGVGHGMKQFAGGPAERVNRNISGNDYGDRIKDGAVHVGSGGENHIVELVILAGAQTELAINVFHHHERAINDNPEIDGADGEQVGVHAFGVQADKREKQRQRNRKRDNHRSADVEKEKNQNNQYQNHSADEVVLHRVNREMNEVAAVVIRMNANIRRQNVLVQVAGFGLNSFEHRLRLVAGAHQDDAFHGVIIFHKAEFAEARRVANHDFADIADAHRHAVLAADHDIADILEIADQADSADVIKLAALRIKSAAGVGVVVGKLLYHRGNAEVVAVKLGRVEQHLILHYRSAKAGIIGHAGDRFVGALKYPVFVGFQLLWTAIRALEKVAINQIARTRERRERRSHAGGKRNLRKALESAVAGEVIIGAVVKRHDDVGKAVERNGANDLQFRNAVHFHFNGDGDEPLDFFGGVARPLRDDFHHRRREIRISIHRHALEGNGSADDQSNDQKQNQKTLTKSELNHAMNHARLLVIAANFGTVKTGCHRRPLSRRATAR